LDIASAHISVDDLRTEAFCLIFFVLHFFKASIVNNDYWLIFAHQKIKVSSQSIIAL